MSIQQNRRLRPVSTDRAIALPVPDAGFHSGLYLPFNHVILGDPDGARVIANGNFAVSWLDSTFDGVVDADGELQTVDAGVGLNGAVTVELAVDRGGELAGSLRLAMIPLPPFTVGSATVSPYVQVKLHLEGTADAGARVSVVAPFHIDSRFTNPGPPDRPPRPRFEPEFGPPDPAQASGMEGRIEFEVVVAFLVAIEGIPVGGPVIGTSLGVIVKIDLIRPHRPGGMSTVWSRSSVAGPSSIRPRCSLTSPSSSRSCSRRAAGTSPVPTVHCP